MFEGAANEELFGFAMLRLWDELLLDSEVSKIEVYNELCMLKTAINRSNITKKCNVHMYVYVHIFAMDDKM